MAHKRHGAISSAKMHDFDHAGPPTVDDDSSDGFGVGSPWVDVANGRSYLCVDASAGAAVWVEVSAIAAIQNLAALTFQQPTVISTKVGGGTLTLESQGNSVILQGGIDIRLKSDVLLFDNKKLWLGTSKDYWFDYSTSGNRLRLRSRDIDGELTEGTILRVLDGQRGVYFFGGITLEGLLTALGGAALEGLLTVKQPTVGNEVVRLESETVDENPRESVYQGREKTTDATTATLCTLATVTGTVLQIDVKVVARAGATNEGAGYARIATYRNDAGTVTRIGGTTSYHYVEDNPAWALAMTISGTDVLVRVTGEAGKNIIWHATVRTWQVSS